MLIVPLPLLLALVVLDAPPRDPIPLPLPVPLPKPLPDPDPVDDPLTDPEGIVALPDKDPTPIGDVEFDDEVEFDPPPFIDEPGVVEVALGSTAVEVPVALLSIVLEAELVVVPLSTGGALPAKASAAA